MVNTVNATAGPDDDGPFIDRPFSTEDLVLKRALVALREHFDTVQIFVTKMKGDDTWDATKGSGNMLARKCQAQEWLVRQDENMRIHQRIRSVEEAEGGGDA